MYSSVISVVIFSLMILLFRTYMKYTNAVCRSKKRLDGRTVIVTGGTSGMGLEIAQELADRGARVIVACPYPDEGAQAVEAITRYSNNNNVVFKLLDLASLESTRKFAEDILNTEDRLDILINNAGVGGPSNITCDGLNFIMQVNYYGAFLLTILLLPLLKKSGRPGEPSRIVNVSSILHWLGIANKDTTYLLTSYANSKICVILFSQELTRRLKGCNVVVNNADPGAVGTNIFATCCRPFIGWVVTILFYVFSKTPLQGAQTMLHIALDEKAGEVSGEYYRNCKLTKGAKRAYDEKCAMKLWEESVRLVRLTEQELNLCLKI